MRVSVPSGAYSGQVLRLEGQGEPSSSGQVSALVITIAIPERAERVLAPNISGNEEKTFLSQANRTEAVAPMPGTDRGKIITKPRLRLSSGRAALLIGLVLLLVTGSFGFFYFTRSTSIQQIPNPYPSHGGKPVLNDPLNSYVILLLHSSLQFP